jgi:hypothetical protein
MVAKMAAWLFREGILLKSSRRPVPPNNIDTFFKAFFSACSRHVGWTRASLAQGQEHVKVR